MEGIVAKRCLRQSSLGDYSRGINTNNTFNSIYRKNSSISKKINKEEKINKGLIERLKYKMKMTLWIQSISSMCFLILIISCSMMDIELIDNNKYIKTFKTEYIKNYSLNELKGKVKSGSKYCTFKILKLVPDKIKSKFRGIYLDLKKEFNPKEESNVNIYNESSKEVQISLQENNGIGVSIEENVQNQEDILQEIAVSTISSEDKELDYIKNNNIKFVLPTVGTVSSTFGDREVIFKDIDPYHTGVDIANVKGTNIVSSIDGVVTKVANNKYNGNFVEITNGGVVTKYAHMNSVSVRQGVNVKAGDLIGKMGATGYSTGPHLHFEVVVEGVKINPAKVLEF